MKKITLNGKTLLTDTSDLASLIQENLQKSEGVICEYNGSIANQNDWATIILQDDDKIELLYLVGGG